MPVKICERCGCSEYVHITHCNKCGASLLKVEVAKSILETSAKERDKNLRMHRMHFWKSLKLLMIGSVIVQTLCLYLIGRVTGWPLVAQGVLACGIIWVVAKLRMGHIGNVIISFGGTLALLVLTVKFENPFQAILWFMSMWLLVFWYVFVGYHIKMNEDAHGEGGIE